MNTLVEVIRPLEDGLIDPSTLHENLLEALETLDYPSGILNPSAASEELQEIARLLYEQKDTLDYEVIEECVERLWILENE